MKFHNNSNVLLATFVITVLAVGIYTTANYLFPTIDDDSSALTYGSNTDVSFTINPRLSISTSTDSLTIDNLVPGTTSDSNTVTVTVASNTPYGYVLSAGVGGIESTDPYYSTSDLVHENSTISNVFSSVDTSASLESLDTDNTWGYSTSTDGGTSWSTYSGLSHAETKPLLDISDPAQPSTIDFKIAARSASTQASGTYNNVITFYAVGKPRPLYMQETEAIKAKLKNVGDELQAIDQRDGKKYWIARLADGNIWMTQNLNLSGGAKITSELSDVPEGYTLPVANGFQSGNRLPLSATQLDDGKDKAFVYNTGKDSDEYCSDSGCYSYYSWTAATAGSGLDITTHDTDAPYSICPKGWKLPSTKTEYATDWQLNSDFYKLARTYGMSADSSTQSTSEFYSQAGPGTTPNFLSAFYYMPSLGRFNFQEGYGGNYWSSTADGDNAALFLYFTPSYVNTTGRYGWGNGLTVRCLFK